MNRYTLRVFLPILVTTFFAVATLVAFGTSHHFTLNELEANQLQELRTRLNASQGTVERFLLLRHPEGVQKAVSASGSDLDLRVQFVADHDGRVLSSTNYREQGMNWAELDYGIDPEIVERVTRSQTSEVVISPDRRWINGYISVCDPHASSRLRARRCGFLFHQIDLRFHRKQAIHTLSRQALITATGFAFCALLFLYAVHRLITARVARLQSALGRFGAGERAMRIGLQGSDELAAIAGQVDGLLDELAADEAALRQSEQLKRVIIDSANASIISTDAQGVILTFSAGAERMLGYRATELVGIATPAVLHDPAEVAERAAILSQELGSSISPGFEVFVAKARLGQADENEWTYVRKNGTRLTVALSVTALFDEHGATTGFLGVARDVTQERAVVQRLRLAEQVFQNAGEAILVTDADTRIVDANPAYVAQTGYEREEILGATPRLARSGRHDADFYRQMWREIERTGAWSGELWDRRKSGEIFPQWLTITAIKDDQGKVSNYVGIFKDVTSQKAAEEKLERMAYYDPLTELPNRALFRDRLEHALEVAKRGGTRLALMFLDLDRFKYVNDTLGHDAGDQLLIEAARRIRGCVRDSDTVARLGGDEFTLVLSDVNDVRGVERVAGAVIHALQQPFRIGTADAYIGASVGIGFYPDDGSDFVTLTKNADTAMYHAKQAGRGTHRWFSHQMNALNARRMELEASLRGALERGELSLHYQPKLRMKDHRVLGFETLLRWRHPALGSISPTEFIPLAEETGLIVPIGDWVLRAACAQLKQWHTAGHADLHVAVNLSVRQFQHDRVVESVRDTLHTLGLPPEALELELTESMLMDDAERALSIMNGLRELGVSLSVDDFGTGHSSLSYLKRFPIQALKIDRSFVRDIVSDPDDSAIIRAVLSMAERLRLKVVAEGVETREQHEFLCAEGCDQAQGYYYARPLAAAAVLDYLRGTPQGVPEASCRSAV